MIFDPVTRALVHVAANTGVVQSPSPERDMELTELASFYNTQVGAPVFQVVSYAPLTYAMPVVARRYFLAMLGQFN